MKWTSRIIALVCLVPILPTNCYEISGNVTFWDSIFASRSPTLIVDGARHALSWTEGPVLIGEGDKQQLLFSDTVENNIYSVDLDTQETTILLKNSGDCPSEELGWRAEPGSNGLAAVVDAQGEQWLVACQHGARRLAWIHLPTGRGYPIATSTKDDKRLNGPNDVVVHKGHAYFTDPVYAWLEKERFEDLPYLDEKVRKEGPGACGVYRAKLLDLSSNNIPKGQTEPPQLVATLHRPNGLGFLPGTDTLVVADCCQGSHNKECRQGTSRWKLLEPGDSLLDSWKTVGVVEDTVASTSVGCADGFKPILGPRGEPLLVASCAGGLCLVDLRSKEVASRLWTSSSKGNHCKVSNVAVGKDRVFLTGNCGIMELPLQAKATKPSSSISSEL